MGDRAPLRVAVLAAFPFPLPLGSQIFVREQLRALSAAGAQPTLLCYGSGDGEAPPGLDIVRVPRMLSSRFLRAGPSLGKPIADAALLAAYIATHLERRFDVALAHNGEAAMVALGARPLTHVPVVYAAHTLLGNELSAYAPPLFGPALRSLGRNLDRSLARASDGLLALCRATAEELRPHARGRVEVIPPGLDPAPPPEAGEQTRACGRYGLEPGGFALYSGNLDGYQDLTDLGFAAERLPEVPVVVATHAAPRRIHPALRVVQVASHREMRALTFAAAVAVIPRRRVGGFPIKLLNYMEAAKAIVAVRGIADGLEHDVSGWLLDPDAPREALADAIRTLAADAARAERLGRGAREQLLARHAWCSVAKRTLALAERVRRRR